MNENWEKNNPFLYGRMKARHPHLWKYVEKFVEGKNIQSILDVGCGTYTPYRFSGDWVGIDVNSTIIKFNVVKSDFLTHDFDREFDMVLIAGVVEHYKARELKRFIEKALEVNPKYILISLFMGVGRKGSRTITMIAPGRKQKMTRHGEKTIERIMKELGLNNYSIERISKKDNLVVVRRD